MNKIKYLIMDVDGTLTDGKVYIGASGEVMKAFNIKDGCGIHDLLPRAGIIPVIITSRNSEIVLNRCKELCITEVYQGVYDKLDKMKSIADNFSEVAYIGDDINDIECMIEVKRHGGSVGCPFDAVKQVKELSDFISEHNGGNGAVRDYIEFLIR